MKKMNWMVGWGCALLLLLAIILIRPRAEMGVVDDWSYIFTMKRLAETGHIFYNGWGAPILGAQLYIGALFIRLFGFSFFVARSSSMFLAVLSTPLAYAVLRRAGVRTWNAALGTLTFFLSPLFLPMATMSLSDATAMFFLLLFFYACLRCLDAMTPREILAWLIAAAVAGLIAGTVRQIASLTVLVSLPCLAWHLRRHRGVLRAGLLLWLLCGVLVYLTVHWFQHQMYTVIEKPGMFPHSMGALRQIFFERGKQSAVSCLLLLLPVLFGIALEYPWRERRRRITLGVTFAAAIALVVALTLRRGSGWLSGYLQGDYVTVHGIMTDVQMLGIRPLAVPGRVQVAVALFLIAVVAVCTETLWMRSRQGASLVKRDHGLLWISVPFTAAYLALVLTRYAVYDRYFLPLLFVAIVAALRWHEVHVQRNMSWLTLLPLACLTYFGIAGTHDLFAETRARMRAIAELQAAGIPRLQFQGGFEYDGWTETEMTGHVNEPRIHPADAFKQVAIPSELFEMKPSARYPTPQFASWNETHCYIWFSSYTPLIHGHYVMQTSPGYCFPDSNLPPVRYSTWLPPRQKTIYIAEVPRKFWW